MQALQSLHSISVIENFSRKKVYRQRFDPFSLDDEEFRERYRYTKKTAAFIVDLVRDELQLNSKGCGTSPELQVLTAIKCWSHREIQENAGDSHGLSQATTSRICSRVALALARHAKDSIKMPSSIEEERQSMMEFKKIKGFPDVIGCIGCTHIKIKKHGGDAAQDLKNRKGFYSINVQVTCDANLQIRDIAFGWRSRTPNYQIFEESTLKNRFGVGQFKGRLLGDSAYTLEPYLFTPVTQPCSHAEEKYNEAHIATRNVVECCCYFWKQRFQCLTHGMSVKFGNVKTTIIALAVLHNIAMVHEEIYDTEYTELYSEDLPEQVHNDESNHNHGENSALLHDFIAANFNK